MRRSVALTFLTTAFLFFEYVSRAMPEIVSPIDGRVAFNYKTSTFEEAEALLGRAEQAQKAWKKRPIEERAALCLKMLDAYRVHLDDNAAEITRMMGKPIGDSRGEFERPFSARVKHLASIAKESLADEVLTDQEGFERVITRDPVGVVLVIAAWNYPLLVPINALAASVLAGNAVMLKHAPQTALVADQIERAFREAGAPEGLVTALHVDHPTVSKLLTTRRFGYVSFTGSVRGGHEVLRAVAQENFIGVGLELGGKDPALVLADCDFDSTVENLVDGAFYNAGQSCCAIERIYVVDSLYDRFVEAYVEKTRGYVVGDPFDAKTSVGPLVNEAAAKHVKSQVADAIAKGARDLLPEGSFATPNASHCYVAPRVFDRVDHTMTLMRDETFGPAIGIMKVADENEAVRLANDSVYGLTASIWSADVDRARRLSNDIQAGTVFLNRCDYLDPGLPWTGVKDSGFGSSLSRLGFLSVTRPKNRHFRLPPKGESK
jgi:acyl-CoA reductase-like NAD-dependent aldehyde dehydrogenase